MEAGAGGQESVTEVGRPNSPTGGIHNTGRGTAHQRHNRLTLHAERRQGKLVQVCLARCLLLPVQVVGTRPNIAALRCCDAAARCRLPLAVPGGALPHHLIGGQPVLAQHGCGGLKAVAHLSRELPAVQVG